MQSFCRPWAAIAVVALVTALAGCAGDGRVAAAPAPADPLLALNQQVRENYAASRTVLLDRQRPAIFVEFDDIVLWRRDATPLRESFTPALYHRYKQVAHLPLGVWATLAPWVDRPDSAAWRAPLQALLMRAAAVRESLDSTGFPAEHLPRQRAILEPSIALMQALLADRKKPDASVLRAYSRSMAPLVLANADDAAALQIDRLHAIVSGWRRDLLTRSEWAGLFVVVLGPKMPREQNLVTQYFERVMGQAELGRRLIYAEGLFKPEEAQRLLGTIVTDRRLASDFFGIQMRMDKDLLADGARKRLDAILASR